MKGNHEMIRKIALSAAAALGLSTGAFAAGEEAHVTDYAFSFEGPFGTFDQMQLQRGLQVYTEICSACHGLKYVPFRALGYEGGPHLPADQVRAYAEFYEVYDEELDDFRPAVPTDHFPESSLSNAPGPTDPDDDEDKEEAGTILYQNTAYPGEYLAMSQPLYGDDVLYEDGTEATIEQQALDVAAFLMWTAEPTLNARKEAGFIAVAFLIVLSVLLYLTNKRLWYPIKKGKADTPAE